MVSLRELKNLATRLSADPDAVIKDMRPAELDYLCYICAVLRAIGVCSDADLPDEFDLLEVEEEEDA